MKTDLDILMAVQDGISLKREPFSDLAEKLNITEVELLERLNKMKDDGTIRRFSANINQRKIGITANAVVVWNISAEILRKTIEIFLNSPKISHLYERRTYPGKWDYNLYSVVHDYDEDSVKSFVNEIADKIGVQDYRVFFSKRRFKGTSSKLKESKNR
jgi:DNA-binding Lrp family transcriptional regulator